MRRATQPAATEANNESIELTREFNNPPDNESTSGVSLAFPEGGRDAWTCLLGSALMMFPSFGFQTASMILEHGISLQYSQK